MTVAQLKAACDGHGLTIDGFHGGAGKFRDVEIGVGAEYRRLLDLGRFLKQDYGVLFAIRHVDVEAHKDFGKAYLEVPSFWWDE